MNKTEVLKMNTMDKMKNAIDSFNSMVYQAEERICELEDRQFDIIQSEEN